MLLKMEGSIVFKSKTGVGIIIFLCLVLGALSIFSVLQAMWLVLVINMIVAAFILHLFQTTTYTFRGSDLHIRCGFFFNKTIPVASIIKITETQNPISAPATSLDRLEILYNKFDTVLVSPADKSGFIKRLLAENNNIVLKLKAQV